jgi:hypothetical protein
MQQTIGKQEGFSVALEMSAQLQTCSEEAIAVCRRVSDDMG